MSFPGFPVAALDFYDDLEMDNSKSFWEANKHIYQEAVRAPMLALVKELSAEFSSPGGKTTVFRPYRDVRFAKDKTPFKTNQGAYVAAAAGTGWYVAVSPEGVRVGGGCYDTGTASLAAIRTAIDNDRTGSELEAMITAYATDGWTIDGDRLKTAPRGYDREHPRVHLLRHKQLFVGRSYGFDEVIHTPELADLVRTDWRAVRPLVEWFAKRVDG